MKTKILLSMSLSGLILVSACSNNNSKTTVTDSLNNGTMSTTTSVKPTGPKPAWAPSIKPEMQAVMEKLASYGDKPIVDLTPQEARKNHTPTDAVMALMESNNIPSPDFKLDVKNIDIPVSNGSVQARVFTPQGASGPHPVIVYYHGGGFVIAGIDVYEASAKALASEVGAIVVAVGYRKAPEHKFPTAHNDAFDAYKWVLENAASMNGDPKKVAVAGESAGGNLAVNTAIKARDTKLMIPTAILAVYPVASSDMNSESYRENQNAKPLDKPMMEWFVKHYLNSMAEANDPRINLVAANLKGLPETTIITAELDPLEDDGKKLEDQLEAASVKVNSKSYDGVTHEFFGMGAVVPQAKEAMSYAAEKLRKAFGK